MNPFLERTLAMFRAWLAWPSTPRLAPMTPSHGWLLPNASILLAQRGAREPRMPVSPCVSTLRMG
jgi:hypothetical protein